MALPNLGRKLGPLPLWGWVAAGVAGVLLVVWLRRRSATTGPPTSSQGALSPYDYSLMANPNPTGNGGNPTIIESLPPDVANSLLGVILGQSQSLEGVAVNAQNALAQVSIYGMTSAFSLAQTAVESNTLIASQIVDRASWATSIPTVFTGSSSGNEGSSGSSSGAAPTSAPAPQLTPAQQVSHAEFSARQASFAATGQWTAGL